MRTIITIRLVVDERTHLYVNGTKLSSYPANTQEHRALMAEDLWEFGVSDTLQGAARRLPTKSGTYYVTKRV